MKKKPKPNEQTERYEYIKAIVDCDGELCWEWRLVGSSVIGRLRHDENVAEWSDKEITNLTLQMLCVEQDDRSLVRVEWR